MCHELLVQHLPATSNHEIICNRKTSTVCQEFFNHVEGRSVVVVGKARSQRGPVLHAFHNLVEGMHAMSTNGSLRVQFRIRWRIVGSAFLKDCEENRVWQALSRRRGQCIICFNKYFPDPSHLKVRSSVNPCIPNKKEKNAGCDVLDNPQIHNVHNVQRHMPKI